MTRLSAGRAEIGQRRAAGALAALGLAAGDRVVFALPSSASLLVAVLGALRSGVVPVLLNPTLLPAERRELIDDAQPQLVVDDPAALGALVDRDLPGVELAPVPLARPMHYTSGTSGRPKGVWSGVLDESQARALFDDEAEVWAFQAGDVHLVCSPLYHSAAVRFAGGTLLSGGEVVLLDRFDPALARRALAEHRPTTAFMVPAHLQRLFASPGELPDLSSFRLLAHAGAPCPTRLKRQAMATFPAGTVYEFYGSTEGQFTVCPSDDWERHPGTVGRARPRRGLEVADDRTIWCHAPSFARFEYWRDPAKTAAAWRGDAFSVGDLGRMDAEGFLYLDGRRDDLVISGGVNVYPMEVERALREVPGVAEVAVFGVSDERWGQRVCAAVVPEPGVSVDPAEVSAYARRHLAPYKCPKQVFLLRDLPRTGTGKVRRTAVAAWLGLEPETEAAPASQYEPVPGPVGQGAPADVTGRDQGRTGSSR